MKSPWRTTLSAVLLICAIIAAGNVSWGQRTEVSPISTTSLGLKIFHNDASIGVATGFVVEKNNKRYLMTNRHVVLFCGQDPSPDDVGGWICANKLAIRHYQSVGQGMSWVWVTEELLDATGKPRWLEHPTLHGQVDLVALPLAHTENLLFHPLDLELRKIDMVVSAGDPVSIVGFPFGMAETAGLPIWKTGTVASDPDVNFNDRPMFIVDTTSRPGMSGSPVYAVRTGAYRSADGSLRTATVSYIAKFLGVYSEQNLNAELGGVWKADVVMALYDSLP
jgi:hypothetical protein